MKIEISGVRWLERIIALIAMLLGSGALKLPASCVGSGKEIRTIKDAVSVTGEADADRDSHPVA